MEGEAVVRCGKGKEGEKMFGPMIDWNGNGKIDASDIAISLARAEEEEREREIDDDED